MVKPEYEGSIQKLLIEEGQQIKLGDLIAELDGEKVCKQPEKPTSSYSFGLAKPKKENICCDIAIIGGGPGGYVSAIRAAQLGASVTLIEKDKIGGTCLNYGCIPTKSFVKSKKVKVSTDSLDVHLPAGIQSGIIHTGFNGKELLTVTLPKISANGEKLYNK